MKILIKIFFIFFFYSLGECIAHLTGDYVPGSVIGMVLLFVALQTKLIKEEQVDAPAKALTDPSWGWTHGSDGCGAGQLVGDPRRSRRKLCASHSLGGLYTRSNGKEEK